jgi:hypothetical protein
MKVPAKELMMLGWINAHGTTMICLKTDGLFYYVCSYCWGRELISRQYITIEAAEAEADILDKKYND